MQIFTFRNRHVAAQNLPKLAKLQNAGNVRSEGNQSVSLDGAQLKCAIRALLLFFGVLLLLLLVAWFGD